MNLGKLLGAGKSFVSGRKSAAYRCDRRVYLPQFISPKNPFVKLPASATQAELPKSSARDPAPTEKKVMPTWIKSQKMPESKAQGAAARATAWVSKLNPVSIFRASPLPKNNIGMPLQVELSLEKVKVIQNDLTDADVEIVPMKSRPARPTTLDNPPAKKSWEELGQQIMKATAL
jgi:hypothetical protein